MWICAGEYRGYSAVTPFVAYALAKVKEQQKTELFRRYVAAGIKMLTENTAKASGGVYLKDKYSTLINPVRMPEKSGEEIAAEVIKMAGLEVVV